MAGQGFNVRLTGDWNKSKRVLSNAPRAVRKALDQAILQEAHFFRSRVVSGIRKQAPGGKPFVPLSPRTLQARRAKGFTGTKALIVTGDLRNSVTVVPVKGGAFVGILRTARRKGGGQALVNIGVIQEFGAPRANIPARPFLQPVFDKHLPNARRRFSDRLRRTLGANLGIRVNIGDV